MSAQVQSAVTTAQPLIEARKVPSLPGAIELLDAGCIPGAAFRNLAYLEHACAFAPDLPYPLKMLTLDPQTSGGILFCAPPERAPAILAQLRTRGCPLAAVIGRTTALSTKHLRLF